ncbi:MAG: hypothetical protein HZA09_05070, partial [Nitrospirae bacterium]|nr:hypothetical protein [Nitrospirota bacterium]
MIQGEIKYCKFDLTLYPLDIIILPSYKGSTLRGGFGNAFRKVVCAIKNKDCLDCLLKEKCIYSYVFETPPPSDTKIMRKYTNAPHPFIIEPPPEKKRGYTPKDEITFGLTLIGKAVDYLPYFIYTFDELGRIGIGKGRGRYGLDTVRANPTLKKGGRGDFQKNDSEFIYSSDTNTLKSFTPSILSFPRKWESSLNSKSKEGEAAPCPYIMTLSFLTPTRLVYNGHLTLDLKFHILIRNLLRR